MILLKQNEGMKMTVKSRIVFEGEEAELLIDVMNHVKMSVFQHENRRIDNKEALLQLMVCFHVDYFDKTDEDIDDLIRQTKELGGNYHNHRLDDRRASRGV